MAEKDYVKTVYVDGSEPDVDAVHLNNTEDGLDGLYHPEFDDSGTVEGITSFPIFLSTVVKRMNPIAFYKNFKAGMKYVLHTGSLINNGLCTETGKYAADATQLNPNIANTLAWQVAKVNSDLALQPILNVDILTLNTGHYYATNCTNLPPGWVAAYLDVERLDEQWCRITAWPPYEGVESPQIIKCFGGTWGNWISVLTSTNVAFFDVSRIDFLFNPATGESVIKFGVSSTRTDQIVVDDQHIRLDRWDGNTWTNIWTK